MEMELPGRFVDVMRQNIKTAGGTFEKNQTAED